MRKENQVRLEKRSKQHGSDATTGPKEDRQQKTELTDTICILTNRGIILQFKLLKKHLHLLVSKLLLDNRVLNDGAEQLQYIACPFSELKRCTLQGAY